MWDTVGLWSAILYTIIPLLAATYFYLTRNFSHFQKMGVPFKTPLLLFGNVMERITLKKAFHELQKEMYFSFKGHPYYGMFEGSSPVLLITDPDLIKNILVKDFDHFMDRPTMRFKSLSPYVQKIMLFLEGKEWKQVRSAVTPAFSSGRLKAMTEVENMCGKQFTKYLREKINENGGECAVLDMKETLGKFTLDTIATTAFGVEPGSSSDPESEMATKIAKFNDLPKFNRVLILIIIFIQPPLFITRNIPVSFFNMETITYLSDVIKDVSRKRKDPKYRRNDFLQLLIDAQSDPLTQDSSATDKSEKGFLLTEEVAIAQAILFFIAGYETSATTLTMLCYELAKNPDVQTKLRGEILDKLKETEGQITYELINDLPYLDMAIAETLRIYPPVARLDRLCVKKYQLNDIEINPGDKVGIPIYGLQNDPDHFPEPDKFCPERFSHQEKEKRNPFLYLPFGAGPRNCIGLRAAQFAMKVCMIHFLKEFKLETCPKTVIPFEFHKASMLLKAKDGVTLQITKLE